MNNNPTNVVSGGKIMRQDSITEDFPTHNHTMNETDNSTTAGQIYDMMNTTVLMSSGNASGNDKSMVVDNVEDKNTTSTPKSKKSTTTALAPMAINTPPQPKRKRNRLSKVFNEKNLE